MMTIKDPALAQYARYVDSYLASLGHTYDTVGQYIADDETTPDARVTRFRLWIGESLRYAIQELDCGNHVEGRKPDIRVVLRCLLQVREYVGRVGGFYPSPHIHDTASFLQNAVESKVS